jgi:hypothetical protein
MSGLLIDGVLVQVSDVKTISPGEVGWAHLSREDFATRLNRPQMCILHKTIADDPEKTLVGSGPSAGAGGTEYTAEYWQKDPHQSAAHLITGHDGTTACLADLVKICGWHANQANMLSYGHEIKEVSGGGCYQAAYTAAVSVTLTATRAIGIQWQCPHKYTGPMVRFGNGGSNLIGIFGHRDVTQNRNQWDPGDEVYRLLALQGVERFDFVARQDIDIWSKRQEWLKSLGYNVGGIDGLPGPKTTAALKALGYPDGIFGAWRLVAEKPPLPPGYTT